MRLHRGRLRIACEHVGTSSLVDFISGVSEYYAYYEHRSVTTNFVVVAYISFILLKLVINSCWALGCGSPRISLSFGIVQKYIGNDEKVSNLFHIGGFLYKKPI